jgi:hypothetical protein
MWDFTVQRKRVKHAPLWGFAHDSEIYSQLGPRRPIARGDNQDGRAGAPQKVLDREIVNCDARTSIDARGK